MTFINCNPGRSSVPLRIQKQPFTGTVFKALAFGPDRSVTDPCWEQQSSLRGVTWTKVTVSGPMDGRMACVF